MKKFSVAALAVVTAVSSMAVPAVAAPFGPHQLAAPPSNVEVVRHGGYHGPRPGPGYGGPGYRGPGYRGPGPAYYNRGGRYYYNGHRGYNYYRPGYRQYNGWWFPAAAFATGAIIGGAIANQSAPAYSGGGGHVAWCQSQYRSYRVSDNTFQPYNGPRQQCVSPY
ncbi:BA14K family protein [Ancylobacter sp. G4_0304]|uniref:BA14K family protein n=1 Tax=Ancylobacter sp. G4_0304 TaxID=3114289 RepID=UPI0039C6B2E5